MKLLTAALTGLALAALIVPLSAAPPTAADTSGGWVGRTVPAFTLPSSQGIPVDMGKVFGTRPVVLIFYRGVWCPFCQAQMTQIGKDREAFVKTGTAARQYAGVYAGQTTLKPAVFVIGRDRKVKYAYLNDNYRLRAADQPVLKAIR